METEHLIEIKESVKQDIVAYLQPDEWCCQIESADRNYIRQT